MTPSGTTRFFRAALSTLYYSRAYKVASPFTRGVGQILMLHHVRPETAGEEFAPNRLLSITPEFLENVIRQVREAGFDLVSLDEAHRRLTSAKPSRPFTCLTFDDGYRDNLHHAYPIFRKLSVPFAIYVPTDYPDGLGDLWWLALEKVVNSVSELRTAIDGEHRVYRCQTVAEKDHAFHDIYWWLRGIDEAEARRFVRELSAKTGVDIAGMCRDLVMTWDEIRQLAADPLVTIGAHTRRHYALAKMTAAAAESEMTESIDRIAAELGRAPEHFSYPYGCAQSAGPREFGIAARLGMKTAVTTRKGMLFAGHANQLMSLPRLSLNGDYQDRRHLSVLLSGLPFYLWNGLRRTAPA
jgi:peptidoglycan/xylan/chitin deacetylase (PgdA/CDA1 family)